MQKKIEGILFQPWKPKLYRKNKLGKLLIIGESHYLTEKDCKDSIEGNNTTSDVVQSFINGEPLKFFKNIGALFNEDFSEEIWQYTAFANVFQRGFQNASEQPVREDFKSAPLVIRTLLNALKPVRVLVCSKEYGTEACLIMMKEVYTLKILKKVIIIQVYGDISIKVGNALQWVLIILQEAFQLNHGNLL
jgi:hypothetical protein